MLCAISEQTPQEAVFSVKSGHIFEKALIEKHIRSTGSCPMTREALTLDDLMPVVVPTPFKPRAANLASMPALLQTMQNEWDSVMLETFTLKQQLTETRKNLAKALYENDAAFRVIARLIQERDAAKQALAELKAGPASTATGPAAAPASSDMEVDTKDDGGMTDDILSRLDVSHKALRTGRKKRIKARAREVASQDAIRSYTSASFSPHSSSHPGILCVSLHPTNPSLSVTGGHDSNLVLFDRKQGKILDTLKGHRKKVTDVSFVGDTGLILSASGDSKAIIWEPQSSGRYAAKHTISCHTEEVVSSALHPSNEFFVTASADKSWAFHDIATGRTRQHVRPVDGQPASAFTGMAFHPDGLLIGACNADKMVNILDAKTFVTRANLTGHKAALTSLAFSQNGTYLATGDAAGTVKLWDLRNVQCFQTITDQDISTVNSLSFDQSGSYLAVGGSDVRLFDTSSWNLVNAFGDHSGAVTSVQFGDKVDYFASTSLDRTVKFWSPPQ
jgi:pre-mRNA-processing factor 19